MATFGLLHRLRPRGLHGRLMWLVSLVTLLTIVALGAHTLATESALALESLRGQASAMARSLALSSVNPMLTDQLDHLEEALLREMVFPGAVSAQVIDARGAILGHAKVGPDGAALLVFEAPGSRLALPVRASTELLSGQLAVPGRMVAWQPVAAGKLLGWARVETRLDPLDALNRQVWLRTLAAGALTVAGSSLLLLWLLRSPMRALDQARSFAADLVRADGRQLVVAADGPQETVELGHALNQAAMRLNQQRETIAATLDQLRQQQLALQDSNLQLGTIFELSPDGLVLFDGEALVRFANPAFFRLTGLAPAAVVGRDQAALEAQLGALCAEPALWAGLASYFEQPSGSEPAGNPIRGRLLALSAPRPSVLAVLGRQAGGAEHGPPFEALPHRLGLLRRRALAGRREAGIGGQGRLPAAEMLPHRGARFDRPQRQQGQGGHGHEKGAVHVRRWSTKTPLARSAFNSSAENPRADNTSSVCSA